MERRRVTDPDAGLPWLLGLVAFPLGSFALMLFLVWATESGALSWQVLPPVAAPWATASVTRRRGCSRRAALTLALGTVAALAVLTLVWLVASVVAQSDS